MYGSYMAPWSTLSRRLGPRKAKVIGLFENFCTSHWTDTVDVIDVCILHYSSIRRYFISYVLFLLYKQIMTSHNQRFNRPGHLNVREAQRVAAAWVTLVISFFKGTMIPCKLEHISAEKLNSFFLSLKLREKANYPTLIKAHNFLQKRNMNYRTGWFTD